MRVLVEGCIRGEPIEVIWDDGVISGDLELVRRARMLAASERRPIDESDPAAFISALERSVAQRLDVTILPSREDVDPDNKQMKDLTNTA